MTEPDDLRERYRDNAGDIPDEAWNATLDCVTTDVGLAFEEVTRQLHELDHHGNLVASTLWREMSQVLDRMRRDD